VWEAGSFLSVPYFLIPVAALLAVSLLLLLASSLLTLHVWSLSCLVNCPSSTGSYSMLAARVICFIPLS
jgi:hypothetical protein